MMMMWIVLYLHIEVKKIRVAGKTKRTLKECIRNYYMQVVVDARYNETRNNAKGITLLQGRC